MGREIGFTGGWKGWGMKSSWWGEGGGCGGGLTGVRRGGRGGGGSEGGEIWPEMFERGRWDDRVWAEGGVGEWGV